MSAMQKDLKNVIMAERRERHRAMSFAIKIGVLLRFLIVAAELTVFISFGSQALFMDALATGIDIAASLILLVFIKLAVKPPDEDHPYGHGRYEPLAGLQLGLFLAIVGFTMLADQWFEVLQHRNSESINPYIWTVPALAMVLLELAYQYLKKMAKHLKSPALGAEAVHYRIDALSTLLATTALLLAAFYPTAGAIIDHYGAIAIALLMVILGINAARKNMHQLMDRKPDPSYFERVRTAALRAQGVRGTEKLLIQQYGPDALVNIDIEVDPALPVHDAHEISRQVRLEIQKEWASVRDVIVHIEPYNDHSV